MVCQILTSESIGRLNETWGEISASKVSTLQNIMNMISKNVDFSLCISQSEQELPIVPDIELLYREFINECTPSNKQKKCKVNFKKAREILKFQESLSNITYPLESDPLILNMLQNLTPLPEEMIKHISHSQESSGTGKSKSIPITIHGLTCNIHAGILSILSGKIEDLLDLLLDPNLDL